MWLSWTLFICVFTTPVPTHVVDRFKDVEECINFFLDNYTPQLPGVMENDIIQDQNRFRPICQYYQNKYRYATLYDTKNRIPVFSAYVYTGSKEKSCRSKTWFIEPQLDGQPGIAMSTEKKNVDYKNQAVDGDYKNNDKGVNRGHILPKCYGYDKYDANSTFTLTNVVPQVISFNGGSWCRMENKVKELMDSNCRDNNNNIRAYGVTGAVPSKTNTLKNEVNIPSLMWTAFCCYDNSSQSWVSVAHWGQNKGEDDKNKIIMRQSLIKLYDVLGVYYPQVSIFPDKCLSMTVNKSFSSSNLSFSSSNLSFSNSNLTTDSNVTAAAAGEDGCCSCDENGGPGMLYGDTRQHTLLVFSVSAIFILNHPH